MPRCARASNRPRVCAGPTFTTCTLWAARLRASSSTAPSETATRSVDRVDGGRQIRLLRAGRRPHRRVQSAAAAALRRRAGGRRRRDQPKVARRRQARSRRQGLHSSLSALRASLCIDVRRCCQVLAVEPVARDDDDDAANDDDGDERGDDEAAQRARDVTFEVARRSVTGRVTNCAVRRVRTARSRAHDDASSGLCARGALLEGRGRRQGRRHVDVVRRTSRDRARWLIAAFAQEATHAAARGAHFSLRRASPARRQRRRRLGRHRAAAGASSPAPRFIAQPRVSSWSRRVSSSSNNDASSRCVGVFGFFSARADGRNRSANCSAARRVRTSSRCARALVDVGRRSRRADGTARLVAAASQRRPARHLSGARPSVCGARR